ncbi:hypothetical protein COT60_03530, partial [Candidatus Pacearchaeota archaeon CG09_land_8_20_14_0_10_30_9]
MVKETKKQKKLEAEKEEVLVEIPSEEILEEEVLEESDSEEEHSGRSTASKESEAVIHIYTSFNNTLVHVTDM